MTVISDFVKFLALTQALDKDPYQMMKFWALAKKIEDAGY